MFRPLIEKKLSQFFGAEVSFGSLKISLIHGAVEAADMVVAGAAGNPPLLKVRHIKAEMSIAKALAGQIAIKSLMIEEPIATIVLPAAGTSPAPRAPSSAPATTPAPGNPPEPPAPARQMYLHALRVTGGEIHFHDKKSGYRLSAEKISGDFREEGSQFLVTVLIASLARRDRDVPLGPMQLTGSFAAPGELTALPAAALQAEVSCGDRCRATITSTGIATRKASIQLTGRTTLNEITALLPPGITLPGMLNTRTSTGQTEITARLKIHDRNVHVEELRIQMSDLDVAL